MVQIIDHPPLIAQRRLKEVTSRFIQDISEKNRCHFQFNNQIFFCTAGSFPALLLFLLPFSRRDSESKRRESNRGGKSVKTILWRLRGDRSYEITAATEQTSFTEFGQDFNRLNINLTWEADSFKDRKQLQIARGIAAHGARQTEVSENKPRAVGPLQPRNKAEEITNATPARLLPRETGTWIKMRIGLGDADGRFYYHDNQNAFRKSDSCFSNY
ncbi:hypothetical protein ALC53_05166 [Atta colombica]|uniref:Uncharacterized protein n=1 Tax=Atta colombica TaxID=520822 RepID=A0A151I449_9HYME|nr:hypothetical protein ALC53_05166 [Atta colombica]